MGLLITGITRVNGRHGAALPRQLAMTSDRHIEPFARMVERVHAHGTKIFCQLHHPGRQGNSLMIGFWPMIELIGRVWPGYWKYFFKIVPAMEKFAKTGLVPPVVAPSPVACEHSKQRTRALMKWEIKGLIKDFIKAAHRVQQTGADGVELHAAHGYLIQQFLSPHTNRRTDEYGGSLENRMRFLLEIIQGIRSQCGKNFPIAVRLSVDEYYRCIDKPGQGIELAEGIEMAKRLEQAGIDAIDVSSANYETMNYWLEPISYEPGWRNNLAKAVKEKVKIPVLAANLIRSAEQAETQLKEGYQDFVCLGRPYLADAAWTRKVSEGCEPEIKRCISCLWCFESCSSMRLSASRWNALLTRVSAVKGNSQPSEKRFRKSGRDCRGRAGGTFRRRDFRLARIQTNRFRKERFCRRPIAIGQQAAQKRKNQLVLYRPAQCRREKRCRGKIQHRSNTGIHQGS